MKETLRKRILSYLNKSGEWINGGEIEMLSMKAGYKPSNASRRCRELVQDGLIDRKIEGKSKSVWYKAKT